MIVRTAKPLLIFILLGLCFAIPGEILNQVLSKHNVAAFGSTMVSYVVLLVFGSMIGNGIHKKVKDPTRAAIIYYVGFGTLGLMVEWFLLGNSPVLDPFQVITQPGMFTFWGTLLLGPRIVMEATNLSGLKQAFLKFFTGMSLLYLLVAAVVPKAHGGIFFGFILFAAGTAALNLYYVKYFRMLAKTG